MVKLVRRRQWRLGAIGAPEGGERVTDAAPDPAGLRSVSRLRLVLRLVMVAFYAAAGWLHLRSPGGFVAIVPPFVPFAREVVAATGVCELAGAVGLLAPTTRYWATRRWAGWGLAAYALCVWPANVWHAVGHVHVPPLPDSWWYHGPRLAFQPVLIWWALFAGGIVDWPFGRGRRAGRP